MTDGLRSSQKELLLLQSTALPTELSRAGDLASQMLYNFAFVTNNSILVFSKLKYKGDNKLMYLHTPAKHILSLHLLISISNNYQCNYHYNCSYHHNYNCCARSNSQIIPMHPNFNVFYISV